MSNLFEYLVYNKETNQLGAVVEVSLLKKTYTVQVDDDEFVTVNIDDAVELQEIGHLGGDVIFEGDVLVSDQGGFYEIEKLEDGNLVLHILTTRYERSYHGEKFTPEKLMELSPALELYGNIHILKADLPQVKFNVQVIRRVVNGEIEYAYACNNKLEEAVDIFPVVFVGHQLLEEKDYSRVTLPYEGYLDSMKRGLIKEVKPQELQNYVTGLLYGREPEVSKEGLDLTGKVSFSEVKIGKDSVELKVTEKEAEKCGCGQDPAQCDCNLWKY
ncbi:hypothetical protein PQE70_gp247 [Bacillus phage vB_BanS_Nate]|uniref:Uncharacterized protein n=1 Tax=Bacillus phage vB_BanS_Nate TaxID=2894788 RepID=A0AAE8YV56_9CAUD|nr:hypothetical protein PQE70_gp247 [Bacillus phage vB_BanS_Nate]UGO51111.1 hypothetical protein NATE_277 [Bacillus phage vB_BanS_Nate]